MKTEQKQQRACLTGRCIWIMALCTIFSMVLVSAAPAQLKKPLADETKKIQAAGEEKQKTAIKPQYGGVLRTNYATDPRSLDPHQETYGATTGITVNTNNTLLRFNAEMTGWELELAESVKQIDDTTYEFKIHKGVRFHNVPPVNGRELTIRTNPRDSPGVFKGTERSGHRTGPARCQGFSGGHE